MHSRSSNFTATDRRPANSGPGPDLRHQWVDLWGESHMRGVLGPGRGGTPGRPPPREARSGADVQPGDLALDHDRRGTRHRWPTSIASRSSRPDPGAGDAAD